MALQGCASGVSLTPHLLPLHAPAVEGYRTEYNVIHRSVVGQQIGSFLSISMTPTSRYCDG